MIYYIKINLMNFFDEEEELELFNKQLNNYIDTNEKRNNSGKLKISIMSATSSYNSILNLKALSLLLKKTENIFFIDSMFNMTRKISNISKKKIFYNQITIKIRPYYNSKLKINLNLVVNLKLFRNGKLQLCGLRSENDGLLSLKLLKNELNNIVLKELEEINIFKKIYKKKFIKKIVNNLCNEKNRYILDYDELENIINKNEIRKKILVENYKEKVNNKVLEKILYKNNKIIQISKYNITLINSDFYVGFKLDRTKVHDFILNECNLFCDFDPCIYQGVLVKFYWNNIKNIQNGVCNCSIPCNGKGSGNGNGECKKITISIFQSGYIIITGKTNRKEINYIYDYIIKLFNDNINKLEQIILLNKNIDKIKRRNISILIKK